MPVRHGMDAHMGRHESEPHVVEGRLVVDAWAVECPCCLKSVMVEKVWDGYDGVIRLQDEDAVVWCECCKVAIVAKGVRLVEVD